jgi:hypothetical protein
MKRPDFFVGIPAIGTIAVDEKAKSIYQDSLLIYRKTGNLRAVQLLLGHTKIESTFRYLGIEAARPR